MEASSGTPSASDPVAKYREPVEHCILWKGRFLGLDLINILTLGTVLIPSLVVLTVIITAWGVWINWTSLLLLIGGAWFGGLGVTLGYHRLFTHQSFETKPWLKRLLGILASMNVQGPVLFWCSCHRKHHQYSDRDGDPHSPHLHGSGWLNAVRGFINAHFGWIIFAGRYRYDAKTVRDLYRDPAVRFVDDYYLLWIALGLLIPAAIGGLIDRSWEGVILGFFWGGIARIALTHHITWSINSFGHLFGRQPFETRDKSRNNWFLALVAQGEGWHNNHHAFPQSARHGIEPGQHDLSYTIIRGMERLGWVWNVRTVSQDQMEQKRRQPHQPSPNTAPPTSSTPRPLQTEPTEP